MAKVLATKWKVSVAGVDLSDHAFDVAIADAKDRVDVSGFSAAGVREYLPGLRDETVTVQFLQDRAAGKVHQTCFPFYQSGSPFPFYVQPLSDAGTTASNPIYGGSACLFSYPAQATLNAREEATLEFSPAPNSLFDWGTVAP
jgi:hypothetical protein